MHKNKIYENLTEDASGTAYQASITFTLETAFGSVKPTGKETRDFKVIIREAKEAKAEETSRKMIEHAEGTGIRSLPPSA